MCDFILFLKNKIGAIFELEYMCSVFIFVLYRRLKVNSLPDDKILASSKLKGLADEKLDINPKT